MDVIKKTRGKTFWFMRWSNPCGKEASAPPLFFNFLSSCQIYGHQPASNSKTPEQNRILNMISTSLQEMKGFFQVLIKLRIGAVQNYQATHWVHVLIEALNFLRTLKNKINSWQWNSKSRIPAVKGLAFLTEQTVLAVVQSWHNLLVFFFFQGHKNKQIKFSTIRFKTKTWHEVARVTVELK